MVEFKVAHQIIKRVDDFKPVGMSVDYLETKFDFVTDEWNGREKTVIFKAKNGEAFNLLLPSNGECLVPWECLNFEGNFAFSVSVFATGENRITTDEYTVSVKRTGYTLGDTPSEPTPDVYAQIIADLEDVNGKIAQASELVEEAETSAQNAEISAQNASQSATDADNVKSIVEQLKSDTEGFKNASMASAISASASAESASASAESASQSAEVVSRVDVDAVKVGNKATVTITRRDGTTEAIDIFDGKKGEKGDTYTITEADYEAIGGIVETNYVPRLTALENRVDNIDDVIIETVEPLQRQADRTDRSLDALWKLNQGIVYDYETDSTSGDKVVPSGAKFGSVLELGGASRKGYQLIKIKQGIASRGGITIDSYDDGKIHIYGTATGFVALYLNKDGYFSSSSTDAQVVTVNGYATSNWNNLQVRQNDANISPAPSNFIGDVIVRVSMTAGTVVDIEQYPMLESGTTAHNYEPYTDQLIDTKVNKWTYASSNLLDESKFVTSYGSKYNDDGYYHIKRDTAVTYAKLFTQQSIPYKAGDVFKITYEVLDGAYSGGNACIYGDGNTILYETSFSSVTKTLTFSPTTDGEIKAIGFYNFKVATDIVMRFSIFKDNFVKYEPYRVIDYPIPPEAIAKCPDYGIGINADCYNYIDFEKREYHHRTGVRSYEAGDEINANVLTNGTVTYYPITEEVIDLSDVLPPIEPVEVEANGTITFDYPNKDIYAVDVPNKEEYIIKLAEVQG